MVTLWMSEWLGWLIILQVVQVTWLKSDQRHLTILMGGVEQWLDGWMMNNVCMAGVVVKMWLMILYHIIWLF